MQIWIMWPHNGIHYPNWLRHSCTHKIFFNVFRSKSITFSKNSLSLLCISFFRLLPTSPNKGTRIPLVSQPQTSLNIQHDTVNLKTRKFEKGTKCTREDKFVLEEKGKENQTCLLNTERVKTPIQNLSSETLPQCHLVGRILTLSEISEVWKIAALSR